MSSEVFTRDAPKIVGPPYMVFPGCILYQGLLVNPPVASQREDSRTVYEVSSQPTPVVFDTNEVRRVQ